MSEWILYGYCHIVSKYTAQYITVHTLRFYVKKKKKWMFYVYLMWSIQFLSVRLLSSILNTRKMYDDFLTRPFYTWVVVRFTTAALSLVLVNILNALTRGISLKFNTKNCHFETFHTTSSLGHKHVVEFSTRQHNFLRISSLLILFFKSFPFIICGKMIHQYYYAQNFFFF